MSNNDERDCYNDCKSTVHGNAITSTITKRAVNDLEVCSYIDYVCSNCESVKDVAGRTALHLAASCGRTNLIRWLINARNANVNAKDPESGYTSLHRSLFYGKINCAIALMEHGANFNALDYDDLTPFDHVTLDNLRNIEDIDNGEVYVWGSNTNYTLGTQHERNYPELLDGFHKEHPNVTVKQVCLDKYHCVLVTSDGNIYSCGHGQGGRLGLNTEQTVLTLKPINLTNRGGRSFCKSASISRDHSVFLTDTGNVWTCGLNANHVLGQGQEKLLVPKQLPPFKHKIEGVCTGRFHTVVWGEKCLYTFGLNGGQLGHEKSNGNYVTHPKLVNNLNRSIVTVEASDGATCFVNTQGDVYVLYDYQIKKIATKFLNVKSIKVIGGRLNLFDVKVTDYMPSELKVVLLTTNGNVHVWQESDLKFRRCIYSTNRPVVIKQLHVNKDELLLVTREGDAFRGKMRPLKVVKDGAGVKENKEKTPFHKFVERDECVHVKLSKIDNVHRAISIQSDPSAGNYALIQVHPRQFTTRIPQVSPSELNANYAQLYDETDRYDQLHDVILSVNAKNFYAHAYVLSSYSETLANLIAKDNNAIKRIEIDLDPFYVDEALRYVYAGTLNTIDRNESSRKLVETCKRLGFKLNEEIVYRHDAFPNLHDVVIKTKDGKCVSAHRCVLAARLEYFGNLFSSRWNETAAKTELTLPLTAALLRHLLAFIYTDRLSTEAEDVDTLCNLLVVADQLFALRLRELCEVSLIRHVNLKTAVQMLTFAKTYNASNLTDYCMEFVCVNLNAVLESRQLEGVDMEDLVDELTAFYCKWNPAMSRRVLTPYSEAVEDERVVAIHCERPVSFEARKDVKTKKKKKRHSSKINDCKEAIELVLEGAAVDDFKEEEEQKNFAPNRLRAIQLAAEKLQAESVDFSYTSLNAYVNDTDFPELSASFGHSKSPNKSDRNEIKHRACRLSQKQRKRLSSESSNNFKESPDVAESPKNPCKSSNETFAKNPWKNLEETASSPTKDAFDMNVIMNETKLRKVNYNKMKTKSLVFTQIEDKALEDLAKFYNVTNVFDEIITAHRVENELVAVPVWDYKRSA